MENGNASEKNDTQRSSPLKSKLRYAKGKFLKMCIRKQSINNVVKGSESANKPALAKSPNDGKTFDILSDEDFFCISLRRKETSVRLTEI